MADRDMPGTGEPNRKASEPLSGTQGNQGQSYKDQAKTELNRAQEQALDSGRETLGAAQTRIRSLLEQQTNRAADQLGSVADALHGAAEQLAKENNGTAAHYAGQAASRVEQVADILRDSTMDDIVGHAERFARRQPEVFVGAAFAIGFLFSRFIKSSGDRRIRAAGYDTGAQRVRNGGYGRDDYEDTGYGRAGVKNFATGTQARGTGGAAGGPAMSEGISASRSGRTNSATAATASARNRDAAELMAGTSPSPKAADLAARPTGAVPDSTLGATPASGNKPQGKLP